MGPTNFESYHLGFDSFAYVHGKAFFDASLDVPDDYHKSHVRVVMQVFAIEVLLKSMQSETKIKQVHKRLGTTARYEIDAKLSSFKKKYPKGHSLAKVFKKLDENIKTALEKKYSDKYGRTLLDDLVKITELFVDLRYLYEKFTFTYEPKLVEEIATLILEFLDEFQNTDLIEKCSWSKNI